MAYHDGRTTDGEKENGRPTRTFIRSIRQKKQRAREREREEEKNECMCVYVYMTSNRLIALRRREIGQISGSSRLRTE